MSGHTLIRVRDSCSTRFEHPCTVQFHVALYRRYERNFPRGNVKIDMQSRSSNTCLGPAHSNLVWHVTCVSNCPRALKSAYKGSPMTPENKASAEAKVSLTNSSVPHASCTDGLHYGMISYKWTMCLFLHVHENNFLWMTWEFKTQAESTESTLNIPVPIIPQVTSHWDPVIRTFNKGRQNLF
jgi:hypothetical protein